MNSFIQQTFGGPQGPWPGPVTSEKIWVRTSLSKSSQRRGRQAEEMILNRMRVTSLELRERSCYVTLQEMAFEISSRQTSFCWRVCNLHEFLKSFYYLFFPNPQTWSSSGVRDALWLKREAVILDILHSSPSGTIHCANCLYIACLPQSEGLSAPLTSAQQKRWFHFGWNHQSDEWCNDISIKQCKL